MHNCGNLKLSILNVPETCPRKVLNFSHVWRQSYIFKKSTWGFEDKRIMWDKRQKSNPPKHSKYYMCVSNQALPMSRQNMKSTIFSKSYPTWQSYANTILLLFHKCFGCSAYCPCVQLYSGAIKDFASWEPRVLTKYFDWERVICGHLNWSKIVAFWCTMSYSSLI